MYITAHNLSNLVTVTQRPIGFFSKIVYGIRYGSVKLIRGIASLLVLHFHWLTPSGYLFLNGRRIRYLCLCSKRIFVSLKCKIKKIFFLNFSFFPECPTYCKLEKSIYNVRYRIFTKFVFQKIKWFIVLWVVDLGRSTEPRSRPGLGRDPKFSTRLRVTTRSWLFFLIFEFFIIE